MSVAPRPSTHRHADPSMADPIINPAAVHEKLAAVPKATHVASKVPAAAVGRMASPAAASDGGEEEGRGICGGGGG